MRVVRPILAALALVLTACGASTAVPPTPSSTAAATAPLAVQQSQPLAPARSVAPMFSGLPAGVNEPQADTSQLVTVLVAGPSSTTGTLQAWQRTGAGWTSALGPVTVRVGTEGVGATREGMNRTPRGTYPIPSTFGRLANPGTKMLYRQVTDSDWWVSDPQSPAYNTFRHCAPGTCGFNEKDGENLGQAGASYDYAAVIGYNTDSVQSGAGSAFFVHVDAGIPSQGCVETPRASVVALLRWLDPAQHPLITIGYN